MCSLSKGLSPIPSNLCAAVLKAQLKGSEGGWEELPISLVPFLLCHLVLKHLHLLSPCAGGHIGVQQEKKEKKLKIRAMTPQTVALQSVKKTFL